MRKHGVTFMEAARAFLDPFAVDLPDLGHPERMILLGMSMPERLLYVALTRSEEELWCSWFERSADDAARGSTATRGPSPWLAPIQRTIAELEKEAAPTQAAEVSARVAELRARLAEGAEETGSGP